MPEAHGLDCPPAAERPRLLFLDAYDSFSNNIVALLTTLLGADVYVLPIDTPLLDPSSPTFQSDFERELSHYAAIVCGPGPGTPDDPKDVGLMTHVWRLREEATLPVLGICLGFQSFVSSFGGQIRRLGRGLHGMVREVEHCDGDVFAGVGPFAATLYNSLCAEMGHELMDEAGCKAVRWRPSTAAPDVTPLAWTTERREDGSEEVILLAARHRERPFWALQYHPESVCTDPAGHRVIKNWFEEAMQWNASRHRIWEQGGPRLAKSATRASLLSQVKERHQQQHRGDNAVRELSWTQRQTGLPSIGLDCSYFSESIPLPRNVSIPDIVEILDGREGEQIILDSANANSSSEGTKDVRGQYSVIALEVAEALRIEHQAGSSFATARLRSWDGIVVEHTEKIPFTHHQSVWELLADFHERRRTNCEFNDHLPFRGGFMGFITYEMGLEDIGVSVPQDRGHTRPDVNLAWITKSLVVDHHSRLCHIQTLQRNRHRAETWIHDMASILMSSYPWQNDCLYEARLGGKVPSGPRYGDVRPVEPFSHALDKVAIIMPEPERYEHKVQLCQEYIAAGESYELCLTDQTTIKRASQRQSVTSSHSDIEMALSWSDRLATPWQLYQTLRLKQPSPFTSYLRLGGATLIRSSPERFVEYTHDGLCSMKPMKGTVRKSDAVSTLSQAEKLLHIPKEEAENLMIVDLVRHDLHGVCGPENVTVRDLMKVEEYTSVFQMITVVEGQLPAVVPGREDERYTGFDVLAASLPPGSMTGAPKKRSCEILRHIEGLDKERSLYSGVVGYMDVTGRGDWSVTIRSLFRWDDETVPPGDGETNALEVWHIGAGGAVTILSTPEGEREEMFTKLAGPLGVFSDI